MERHCQISHNKDTFIFLTILLATFLVMFAIHFLEDSFHLLGQLKTSAEVLLKFSEFPWNRSVGHQAIQSISGLPNTLLEF